MIGLPARKDALSPTSAALPVRRKAMAPAISAILSAVSVRSRASPWR